MPVAPELSFSLALLDASGVDRLGPEEQAWIAQAVQQAALSLGASQPPVVTFVRVQAPARRRSLAATCTAGSGGSSSGCAGSGSTGAAWEMVVMFAPGDEAVAQQLGSLLVLQPELMQSPDWGASLVLADPLLDGRPLQVAAQAAGGAPPPGPLPEW